jgi:hypothetical protein
LVWRALAATKLSSSTSLKTWWADHAVEAELQTYVGMLSSGTSQAALAVMAAETEFTAEKIGLTGLVLNGWEYI